MSFDSEGNLYLIDQRADHDVIFQIQEAGAAHIIAGGSGEFGRLIGIEVNRSTNTIFVADASS